jgi:hypothetical protein
MPQSLPHNQIAEQQRERILSDYFKVASISGDNRELIKRFLLGGLWSAILTPLLFYLWFGTVDWFAIGFTIFLAALCLLFALGLFFQTKTEYHTNVPIEGSIADRIGGFWLVACAFGPFFGWIITAFPPTENSWKWQYLARAFLSVVLPVITAVPLVPYVRGKAALIAIPLLLIITALPISSCLWVLGDLHDGRVNIQIDRVGEDEEVWAIVDSRSDAQISEALTKQVPSNFRGRIGWLRHTNRIVSMNEFTH